MDITDEQFRRFLDLLMDRLGEPTPSVRMFVGGVRAGHIARSGEGGPGTTAETLVGDLVGILSDFELRIRALEESVG
ncbi:hypothetical protein [Enemella evansiae]|uniref:hypothetical protein n=1 Tax=Enemella evansiae TaxID=2016499 RepID=UPI000B962814|nr:hypothetical protein [Enemella evansiae]PFG67277.1 hypothetical protein B0O41_2092 [Propionibacteriaceae bacterium ES.041]OYN98349.1 hypothetical protein CGZ95_14365 [Enemella evansiae]OYN99175.1 hypothetical protein CGZ96_08055 [Enemella evansiae]OYO05264.1 hypothetical protein CGZ97_00485 [Enemella evansiae]TDO93137.1 hypothetical protein C8D81_0916 [Enemella evansiae]